MCNHSANGNAMFGFAELRTNGTKTSSCFLIQKYELVFVPFVRSSAKPNIAFPFAEWLHIVGTAFAGNPKTNDRYPLVRSEVHHFAHLTAGLAPEHKIDIRADEAKRFSADYKLVAL